MKSEGNCRTGSGFIREDPDLLKGILAEDACVPGNSPRLRVPHTRCAACAARGVRCFHDQVSFETPEGYAEEYEAR